MRKSILALSLMLLPLLLASPAKAMDSVKGWCEEGNRPVVTSGLNSTTRVQASHPSCTVTVYIHGGGLATIYSDNNLTHLANPFTAQAGGRWQAYSADGRYDVTMSSAGFTQTVTYSDIILCDPFVSGSACGGGGGGGGADHNLLSLTHLDTVPFSPPVRGDLVTAQNLISPSGVTPAWSRLALGTSGQVLLSSGLDALWGNITAGSGITINNGGTTITISSSSSGGTAFYSCEIIIGADNAPVPLVDGDVAPQGRQCFTSADSTIVEVDVAANAGTPSVVVDQITPAGAKTNLLSSALSTAASGGVACSNVGGTLGIDGVTTCSATLQNTSILAGRYVETTTATAGGTAKRVSVTIVRQLNGTGTTNGTITAGTSGQLAYYTGAGTTLGGLPSSNVSGVQGNGSKVQLSTGSTTSGNCAKFDANGNTVDFGNVCGAASGVSGQTASVALNTQAGTSSSWQDFTVYMKIPNYTLIAFPASFKAKWYVVSNTCAADGIKILTTTPANTTVTSSTTVTVGSSATPTFSAGFTDSDTIALALDASHDFYVATHFSNAAGNASCTVPVSNVTGGGFIAGNHLADATIPALTTSAVFGTGVFVP